MDDEKKREEKRRRNVDNVPPDHKVFRAKKTMRVPVKERKEALENKASIEHWLKDPNESLGVVFDRNERLSEDEVKVFVASKKKIMRFGSSLRRLRWRFCQTRQSLGNRLSEGLI